MGTNSAPLVADLFLYCYERDFLRCTGYLSFTKDHTKVQVGKDQEKAQSEKKIPTAKTEVGKKTN